MKALQLLTEIDYQVKRDLYKNIPLHAVPRTKFSDKTSNGLTRAILTWLKLHSHYAVRVTTTGRQIKGETVTDVLGRNHVMKGTWIPGTTRNGTSDVHAIVNGKHCSIEIKIGLDRLSTQQERTKQDVEKAGGCYYVATDFESFVSWYSEFTANRF